MNENPTQKILKIAKQFLLLGHSTVLFESDFSLSWICVVGVRLIHSQ